MDGITELQKEFEAAYPMPEGLVRNQWGKYSPFDKETFLMTESLIYNVRYEVYQAAALKRDAEIAALRKELEAVKVKHYRECAVIAKSCQSGLGAANFIDAAMQSGTTESTQSEA